jgi:hypothetical protein
MSAYGQTRSHVNVKSIKISLYYWLDGSLWYLAHLLAIGYRNLIFCIDGSSDKEEELDV